MQMSGEVAKAARIGFDELEPGDVLFCGSRGPKSKPAQINHTGIYLGSGWFIHSLGYGVALAKLDGWYAPSLCLGPKSLDRGGARLTPKSPKLVMLRRQGRGRI